jgi:lysophospholipase L1-like esterase
LLAALSSKQRIACAVLLAIPLAAASATAGLDGRLTELDDTNDGEDFFAYGDSIVGAGSGGIGKADGPNLLCPTRCDSWVFHMRNAFAPAASADINQDGPGKGTAHGLARVPAYFPGPGAGQTVFMEYGINDCMSSNGALGPEDSAAAALSIVHAIEATGRRVVWDLPITMTRPYGEAYSYQGCVATLDVQRERMAAMVAAALAEDRMVVPLYDAIDEHPYDGVPDPQDPYYTYDGLHIRSQGHVRLAELQWFFLSGQDRSLDWRAPADDFEGGKRPVLVAHYPQTVVVPTADLGGVAKEDVRAFDLTDGVEVPVGPGAGDTVHIAVQAGHEYILSDDAVEASSHFQAWPGPASSLVDLALGVERGPFEVLTGNGIVPPKVRWPTL